ncbi:MAG TPA: glutathione S-transferase N-terminal domain-containing protein [Candidatus Binataceae bacterium]
MLTLYYAPGACSTASHIGIEESGARYEARAISFANSEQRSEAYLKINPRGRVPALDIGGEILVENTAILTYLARKYPAANLLPADVPDEARSVSTMAWFASTVHPSFTHINRPERFADDPAAHASIKETGRRNFWANLQEIDGLLKGKDWMMGAQYTVCDPYTLIFYGWGLRIGLPMRELAAYTAFKDRMLARPAVRKILEREKNVLVTAPAA